MQSILALKEEQLIALGGIERLLSLHRIILKGAPAEGGGAILSLVISHSEGVVHSPTFRQYIYGLVHATQLFCYGYVSAMESVGAMADPVHTGGIVLGSIHTGSPVNSEVEAYMRLLTNRFPQIREAYAEALKTNGNVLVTLEFFRHWEPVLVVSTR